MFLNSAAFRVGSSKIEIRKIACGYAFGISPCKNRRVKKQLCATRYALFHPSSFILYTLDLAFLGVVDVNAGGDVHRRGQDQTFPDLGFGQSPLQLSGNVDKLAFLLGVEPQVFRV